MSRSFNKTSRSVDLNLPPSLKSRLVRSGSYSQEEQKEQDTSYLPIAPANDDPSSMSMIRSPSASYYKEYLRNTTLADCRLSCRGAVITAEWTTAQGIVQRSSLNLDLHIGNIDGILRWGYKDFRKSCRKWGIRGTILYASCRRSNFGGPEGYYDSKLDLNQCIHISGGVLSAIAHVDFSDLMSEVNWMNFMVIAEPDMGKLFSHPAFRDSVSGIADRAVEHVMEKTQTVLQTLITEALGAIQESAEDYIESEIKTIMYTTYLQKSQSGTSKLDISKDEDYFNSHVRRSRYSAVNGVIADGLRSGEHSRRNSDSSEELKGELENIEYSNQVADTSILSEQTAVELEDGTNAKVAKEEQKFQ